MKRNRLLLLFLLFYNPFLFAQNADCDAIISFLTHKEVQIAQLSLTDPDYIPLHYLVAQDIIKEFNQFRRDVIPNYMGCKAITLSELINKYDELNNSVLQKYDSLFVLNEKVYLIFYEKALFEYQFNNEEGGKYFLDRSLQYNASFPNAVLFKLNKLLDKNLFQESLSLLNTLYYDTEMDDEQEKQAIVFTDKFYDKLYNTADSLLKMEHATEALELFEILEIFCQNLPTAYCNDDYYHGVLSSKTGIYESYITIANVAKKRGNLQIAEHFYQYAQEYLDNNPHLQGYEPKQEIKPQKIIEFTEFKEETVIEEVQEIVQEIVQEVEQEIVPALSHKELKEKYDQMVLLGLALCLKEDFSASYKTFSEAKKLEECSCFATDFRVDLMLRELSKILD